MSAYTLPSFNLTISIWDAGQSTSNPPARTALGQFYVASKGMFDVQPNDNQLWQPPIYCRFPIGTLLQVNGHLAVPGARAPHYRIRWVETVHLGFSNQYITAIVEQSN
jgi:hypothetical protein